MSTLSEFPTVEEIANAFCWSAWQEKDTRHGPRMIRTARIMPPHDREFWQSWKHSKADWYELGYGVSQNGIWCLNQFLTTDGQVPAGALEMAAQARNEEQGSASKHNLPADWVPEDVTLDHEASKLLYGYQRPAVMRLKRALKLGNALDASDTGCHAKGTMILMANGDQWPVEYIREGDAIMGWDGTARLVRSLARGREEMARIIPTKGDAFTVNLSHILTLQYTEASPKSGMGKYSGHIVDITVRDYLGLSKTHKHCLKLIRRGVYTWPERELPIDPYHLGVILGDGCIRSRGAMSITKPGPEMEAVAHELAAANGATIRTVERSTNNPSHYFRGGKDLWAKLDSLELTTHGSHSKFIPVIYRTASVDQRRKMLAGLLDTDGSLTNGGYDFISASWEISDGVIFIARSLGLAAYLSPCEKFCQTGSGGIYWRVSISGDCSALPIRIPHKKPVQRKQIKSVLRTGFEVDRLPEGDFYGFSLEGDGRFLLGDFTVTHNTGKTACALTAAAELGMVPCIIAPLAVLPSWRREAIRCGVRVGWVINYDKIRTGKSGLGRWKMVEVNGKPQTQFAFDYLPPNSLLVFDEVQKCKSDDSLTGQLLRDASSAGHRILSLSATAAKDPTEMRNLGAMLGLHDGTTAGWRKWCMMNGCRSTSYGLKFDQKNRRMLDHLHRQIFPLKGNRIRVADLPEFPETQILAECLTCDTDKISSAYSEMDRKLAEIERSQLTAQAKSAETLAAIMAARRAAEEGKLALFQDLAEESIEEGRSVAVFLNFRDHCQKMMDELKTDCVVWGGQKPEDRQFCIDQFQADKRRIIIISLQAGGAGLSLHDLNGNHPRQALISPSYSAIDLKQALGRCHRAGAKTKSFQKIVFAEGTIEEEICRSIREKLQNIDRLNDGHLAPPSILKHVLTEEKQPQLV